MELRPEYVMSQEDFEYLFKPVFGESLSSAYEVFQKAQEEAEALDEDADEPGPRMKVWEQVMDRSLAQLQRNDPAGALVFMEHLVDLMVRSVAEALGYLDMVGDRKKDMAPTVERFREEVQAKVERIFDAVLGVPA